jgi:hypothetical protein
MTSPKTPTAGPAPRSATRQLSYKRAVTVVATFAVATAFALAGAPAATASTTNQIPFKSCGYEEPDCGGGGGGCSNPTWNGENSAHPMDPRGHRGEEHK